MKTYEKRTKTYEETILVERKCDLCGSLAKTSDWGASCYEVNETEISVSIKQKEGQQYPECGSGTEYEVDMCPDCFKNKLVPWLRSQGVNAFTKDPQQIGGICCGPFIPDIRKMTDTELKAAVAKVCLKPSDPCDPNGVFNE